MQENIVQLAEEKKRYWTELKIFEILFLFKLGTTWIVCYNYNIQVLKHCSLMNLKMRPLQKLWIIYIFNYFHAHKKDCPFSLDEILMDYTDTDETRTQKWIIAKKKNFKGIL